ncbi:MAG: hypothetical protein HYV09_27965 [Deltaproteobacteria bacterium]|nr:hypothetical protein [Deltaproteobacteria bacterium]
MGPRSWFAVVVATFALAIACAPKPQPTAAEHGVATRDTWVALEKFGTRIQVPPGWEFAQGDGLVASFARDASGGWSLAGAADKSDAKAQLALGLREMGIELGAPRGTTHDVDLHGIVFARQDFDASVSGKPAQVTVLAADEPPRGKGMVIFIGYAVTGDEARRDNLRSSIASIGPR